jgi:hypothetical protein
MAKENEMCRACSTYEREKRSAYGVLVEKSEAKKSVGKLRHRRENSIVSYLGFA